MGRSLADARIEPSAAAIDASRGPRPVGEPSGSRAGRGPVWQQFAHMGSKQFAEVLRMTLDAVDLAVWER
jgi:hypothetical protein